MGLELNYCGHDKSTELLSLFIWAGALGQEVLGVEAQEALDPSHQTTSWEGQLGGSACRH